MELKYPQIPIACNVFTPDHNIIKVIFTLKMLLYLKKGFFNILERSLCLYYYLVFINQTRFRKNIYYLGPYGIVSSIKFV